MRRPLHRRASRALPTNGTSCSTATGTAPTSWQPKASRNKTPARRARLGPMPRAPIRRRPTPRNPTTSCYEKCSRGDDCHESRVGDNEPMTPYSSPLLAALIVAIGSFTAACGSDDSGSGSATGGSSGKSGAGGKGGGGGSGGGGGTGGSSAAGGAGGTGGTSTNPDDGPSAGWPDGTATVPAEGQ